MPAILKAEDYDAWLTGSVNDARAVLRQYDAGLMTAYPVSTRVNTPESDDPGLLERVDPDAYNLASAMCSRRRGGEKDRLEDAAKLRLAFPV